MCNLHQVGHTLVSGASSLLPGCGSAGSKAGVGVGPAVCNAEGPCPQDRSTAFPGPTYLGRGFLSLPASLPAVGSRQQACPCLLPPPPAACGRSSLQLQGGPGVPSLGSCRGWVATDIRLRAWPPPAGAPGKAGCCRRAGQEGGEGAVWGGGSQQRLPPLLENGSLMLCLPGRSPLHPGVSVFLLYSSFF